MIKELEAAGFWVFGEREVQRLEEGIEPPSAWPVALLKVIRSTNADIIKATMSLEQPASQSS